MKFSIAAAAGMLAAANALALPEFFSSNPLHKKFFSISPVDGQKRSDATLTTRTLADRATQKRATYSSLVTSGSSFINNMVSLHNQYREHHGAGDLTWSDTLAQKAASTAQNCIFQHSAVHTYGENVGAGSVQFNNPAYFIYLWYNEIQQYNYSNPGYSSATGHFTQVIWKSSQQLGCAWITGCSGTSTPQAPVYPQMVWCEYSPSGNVLPANPYFVNNVLIPLASPAAPVVPPYHT